MKICISADIEGITGIAHGDETEKSKSDYQKFAKQMTDEVKAACEGAINSGASNNAGPCGSAAVRVPKSLRWFHETNNG